MLDSRVEDRERQAIREERIARMRREKQQREALNRLMQKLLPLGVGIVCVVVIITVSVIALRGKAQEEETQQAQISQTSGQETEQTAQLANNQFNVEESNVQEMPETVVQDDSEMVVTGVSEEEPEVITPIYNFETTEDTVTIYSENVISSNAILIDESTDTIIASKGANERISPASMTKVLTVLVAAEHIPQEKLDDTFTMTLEITDYAYVNDCSSVGFLDGEEVTVRDLFYGTILPSGGDAAVGLATYVAGSHEAFVDMMNDKLEELGLSDTAHFTNCVGLYDEEHYCTVYDMAVIMKAAVQNEFCKEVLSAHTYTTTPTTEHPEGITISNWFLRRIEDKDTGGEVLCGKTGYVVQSKNCAVSYGTFAGGTPYICVTAGSTSSWRCIYDHVEIYTRYIAEDNPA